MSREGAMALAAGQPVPAPAVESTPAGSPGLQAVPDPAPAAPAELESTRFKKLADKEAAIVKEREAIKAERAKLLAERETVDKYRERINLFEETKKKDPVAAIKMLDFTDTDFMNYLAAQEDKSTPEERAAKAVQQELQKFKDEQAAEKLKLQAEANAASINMFNGQIDSVMESDKAKYEYCNYEGPRARELVFETAANMVADNPKVFDKMSPRQIAVMVTDMVEDFYEKQDHLMMSTIKKRQPKPAEPAAPAVKEEPMKPEVSPRPRTITNKITPTVAATTPVKETRAQKRERLMERLRNGG